VSSLPIVAFMTFDETAETLAGVSAREASERLEELERAAAGADTRAGPAARPHRGLASLAGGRVVYPHATPDYFAEFAAHARDLGARIIGGCCGTTPGEIAAIHEALPAERKRADGKPRARLEFPERELLVSLGEELRETGLARTLREGDWVVTIQLDPPLG